MRLIRGHPSTAFSKDFSGKPGPPARHRRHGQNRPILQLSRCAATQSHGLGSLILRRKVARSMQFIIITRPSGRGPWPAMARIEQPIGNETAAAVSAPASVLELRRELGKWDRAAI